MYVNVLYSAMLHTENLLETVNVCASAVFSI